MKPIRAVVFDLDGTLADTADLAIGRRRPYDVLKLSPPASTGEQLRFDDRRYLLPGFLAARGYRVGVVTNSPVAYASTLLDLLNIDFERLLAGKSGGFNSKTQKLLSLASDWGLDEEEILYVGDTEEDKKQAEAANCKFLWANKILDLEMLQVISRLDTSTVFSKSKEPLEGLDWEPNEERWDILLSNRYEGCSNCGGENLIRVNRRKGSKGCESCESWGGLSSDENNEDLDRNRFIKSELPGKLAELEATPGVRDREDLQLEILYNLPFGIRDCIVDINFDEGIFQFPLWLVTKSEIRENVKLLNATMWAASEIFPKRSHGSTEFVVRYDSKFGKSLFEKLKNFRSKKNYHRPEPYQSLGFFPALVMAGHILKSNYRRAERLSSLDVIFPLPAHEFIAECPGEFSLRLSVRISRFLERSEISGAQYINLFERRTVENDFKLIENPRRIVDELPYLWDGRHGWYSFVAYLIDDQFTRGNAMRQAESLLSEELESISKREEPLIWFHNPVIKFTWSKSIMRKEFEQISANETLLDESCLMPLQLLSLLGRDCSCGLKTWYADQDEMFDWGEPELEQRPDLWLDIHDVKDVLKKAPIPETLLTHSLKIKNQREKYSPDEPDRAMLRWRPDEEEYLKRIVDLGVSLEIICEILQRSRVAIKQRIRLVVHPSAQKTYWSNYSVHPREDADEVQDEIDYCLDLLSGSQKLNSCPYCHLVFNWAVVKITERCPHCDERVRV